MTCYENITQIGLVIGGVIGASEGADNEDSLVSLASPLSELSMANMLEE